jgi:hypothetical protein
MKIIIILNEYIKIYKIGKIEIAVEIGIVEKDPSIPISEVFD